MKDPAERFSTRVENYVKYRPGYPPAVVELLLAHPAIDPGLATFWDRTVRSQIERESPFSIWGLEDGLRWLDGSQGF